MSIRALGNPRDKICSAYLIVCDCLSKVLNKAAQGIGMVVAPQELHKPMALGKRFEFGDNAGELSRNDQSDSEASTLLKERSTNFLRTSLLAFSSLSPLPTGYASIPPSDRILSSMSLISSALAVVCY